MKPQMEKIPYSNGKRCVSTPAVKDEIYLLVRISSQQILKALDYDKRVFPVEKPPVHFTSMDIGCCWHFQQPTCLLLRRILHKFFLRVDVSAILLYGNLCFLVETKVNSVG